MENYLELDGLRIYPKGNAVIKKQENDNTIEVAKLQETTDGIIIETEKANTFDLFLAPITIQKDRWKTVSQWAYSYDPDTNKGQLAFNSLLEGDKILLQAFKNGEEVYNEIILNNNDSTDKNWIVVAILVVAAASVVLSNIDYSTETKTVVGPDGKVTTTTTKKKSFGGGGVVQPQLPKGKSTNDETDSGIEFDHLYVTSSRSYNAEVYPLLDGPVCQVVLTGNLQEITLNSISHES